MDVLIQARYDSISCPVYLLRNIDFHRTYILHLLYRKSLQRSILHCLLLHFLIDVYFQDDFFSPSSFHLILHLICAPFDLISYNVSNSLSNSFFGIIFIFKCHLTTLVIQNSKTIFQNILFLNCKGLFKSIVTQCTPFLVGTLWNKMIYQNFPN